VRLVDDAASVVEAAFRLRTDQSGRARGLVRRLLLDASRASHRSDEWYATEETADAGYLGTDVTLQETISAVQELAGFGLLRWRPGGAAAWPRAKATPAGIECAEHFDGDVDTWRMTTDPVPNFTTNFHDGTFNAPVAVGFRPVATAVTENNHLGLDARSVEDWLYQVRSALTRAEANRANVSSVEQMIDPLQEAIEQGNPTRAREFGMLAVGAVMQALAQAGLPHVAEAYAWLVTWGRHLFD
jgi:hypothetical protein